MLYGKLYGLLTKYKPLGTLRVLGFIELLLGLSFVFPHDAIGGELGEPDYVHALIHTAFVFCGLFGVLGNGKHRSTRGFILSLPYMYLFVQAISRLLAGADGYTLVVAIIAFVLGTWAALQGDERL